MENIKQLIGIGAVFAFLNQSACKGTSVMCSWLGNKIAFPLFISSVIVLLMSMAFEGKQKTLICRLGLFMASLGLLSYLIAWTLVYWFSLKQISGV